MPAPEITLGLLGGRGAAEHAAEIEALRSDVCGPLPDGGGSGARSASDFRVQCRQPGFALAEARSGGYLIGCAAGMPLRPATSWWRDLTAPLPEDFTAEHPGRTFALTGLLVRASWRRQGIGRSLHDLILARRSEERATLLIPSAAAVHTTFLAWGWRKVARARNPDPSQPASDVLVITLPAGREG